MVRSSFLALALMGLGVFSLGAPAFAAPAQAVEVPAGVRFLSARLGGDGNMFGRNRGRQVLVFADLSGRPLYFSSTGADCTGACLEKWTPALAPERARASGDWTLVRRDGGQQQWALRGKPLYALASEEPFHKAAGVQQRRGGFNAGRPVAGEGVDGMTVARMEPSTWLQLPYGVGTAEYRMAPGQMLAVDPGGATPLGKPLYLFSGSARDEQALPQAFRPHEAAELDLPVGDFTVRERADGSRQWAYQGAALYTCDCDVEAGDVNGKGVKGITPAVMLRYPMPAEVALSRNRIAGGYMVEAKTGQTLYYRDRIWDNFEPDNIRPLGGPHDPTVGATLATAHCDAQCETEWKPLLAPRGAQPQGYWSVYTRPDGALQWAYKNYAVYTHAGEPAGVLHGNETYRVAFNDGVGGPVPDEYGISLVWRALMP